MAIKRVDVSPASASKQPLARYHAKRDFSITPEPAGKSKLVSQGNRFVIQKHAARRLHYDFRLEMNGTLKSWAVTKGPSLNPSDRRLAVHVEDHPLDYGDFEGVIPKGQYGGGTVMLWDQGTWHPQDDPERSYKEGKLRFVLNGHRLRGEWTLVRMGGQASKEGRDNWLLIKSADKTAKDDGDSALRQGLQSVATGRTMDEIAQQSNRIWNSKRSKQDSVSQKKITVPAGAAKRPFPGFIEPQMAQLVAATPEGGEWLHEVKFDGYRIQAHIDHGRIRLLTRRGLDWTERFRNIADALKSLSVTSAILDGEVVALEDNGLSNFSLLQQKLSDGATQQLIFYIFDLLYLNDHDLRPVPLISRKDRVEMLVQQLSGQTIRYSDHIIADGAVFFRHACQLALEGVVSKRKDAAYVSGRTRDWQKSKCGNQQEFVIGGYTWPSNKSKSLGALILGYYDGDELVYAGRVGTGFSDTYARTLRKKLDALKIQRPAFAKLTAPQRRDAHWVKPDLVCDISFRGWTHDNHIRQGAFKGLREDKPPQQVKREIPVGAPPTPHHQTVPATNRNFSLTNPDRVLYPEQGITKQDLAQFYTDIADWILPHVVNRPLSLVRCPQGRSKKCFYQKHLEGDPPRGLGIISIAEKDAVDDYAYVQNADGLISLVQMGVLEIHPWGSRIDAIEHPDRMIFDLDPSPGISWKEVIAATLAVRDRLQALGLASFLKTTGGKGLHVVVPLSRTQDWPVVRMFAEQFARKMAFEEPDKYSANLSKKAREGKIFIDYLRNNRGATAIAPYSPRARANAPVATPLDWSELSMDLHSDHFTVTNLYRRLSSLKTDPWAAMPKIRQSITQKMRAAMGEGRR